MGLSWFGVGDFVGVMMVSVVLGGRVGISSGLVVMCGWWCLGLVVVRWWLFWVGVCSGC